MPTRTRLLRPLSPNSSRSASLRRAVVVHFAVAHGVGSEWTHLGALGQDRAVRARLDGGDEAGLDVESDDLGPAAAAEVPSELQVQAGGFVVTEVS